jgi:GH43 family beta-xylosidase
MIAKSISLLALSASFLTTSIRSFAESLPEDNFINPIGEGADPWITRDPNADRYLWCFSEGNRGIAIHATKSLTSLGEKHIVWGAPDHGPTSREVWAPELHWIQNRWHIYFAPSNGQNRNHRAYVLRSKTQDPLGEYEIHGPLPTGKGPDGISPNIWAIDMTPLEHNGNLYAIWSGWDEPDSDRQFLYIAPMKSPVELAGPRVLLCANDEHPWEFTEENRKGRGLHEGPQVLKHGNRTFLTYSTGASWLPTYKLGLLELTGANPLDPKSWKKSSAPVFTSTETTFGVGHSCFVPSPDGQEKWHIYHAKQNRDPGWKRAIFAQPMTFTDAGFPDFGKPLASNKPIPLPSGTEIHTLNHPYSTSFKSTSPPQGWSPYGHHQFFSFRNDGLHLGTIPQAPINDYRSGEKLVLDSQAPPDFTASVTLNFNGKADSRDAGILFRTTAPSIGYDAQRGYFAGIIPNTKIIILGRTDGKSWTELARAPAKIDPAKPQRLQVTCQGPAITIQHNGHPAISFSDSTYTRGTVGLRVVDTHAIFTNFSLTTPD